MLVIYEVPGPDQGPTFTIHVLYRLIHSKNLNSLKPHINETENGLKSSKLWAFPTAGADPKWERGPSDLVMLSPTFKVSRGLLYPDFSLSLTGEQ